MSMYLELRRRSVFRAGVAWLTLSWLLLAMCALLFPALGLALTDLRWLILALAFCLLPICLLTWRYEQTPRGWRVRSSTDEANPQREITARRIDQITVVMVLAALSLTLIRQFIDSVAPEPQEVAPVAEVAAPAKRPARAIDPHSLAVLPFTNMSPDAGDAYFGDGLAEELLNVLSRVDGLKVTSRTSSFSFRSEALALPEIAAQLGVAYLLEGSVRREGDSVRISVQLVRAEDDFHVWAQTYNAQLVDIFKVQEDISQAIADALSDSLGVRRVQVATATTDMQAYERYLRGRQLFVQRGSNLPAARELLEQAVERDPQFADAWAILAGTWYVWRSYGSAPEGIDTRAEAEAAAARALAINPQHPGALSVSARLAADRGERQRHADLIRQALAIEPNNANTWLWQGLGLYEVGHIKAAHASYAQAQQLDPLSGLQLGWLGITTALLGDLDAGRAMLQQAHALGWRGPASRALFLLKQVMLAPSADERADISQLYSDWLRDDDSMPVSQRDLARALAPALVDAALQDDAQRRVLAAAQAEPQLEWALLLQTFGLTEAAVASVNQTERAHLQALPLALWYPQFHEFRQHPAFMTFAEQHGLAEYWRVNGLPDHCQLRSAEPIHLECTQ